MRRTAAHVGEARRGRRNILWPFPEVKLSSVSVNPEGLGRLTEGQKTCLRMVYRHMSSKDIARELGISPHTVDQRLRIAMHALGACSRIEAARLLAAREEGAYQPPVYQSPHVAPPQDLEEQQALVQRDPEGQADGRHFGKAQAAYLVDSRSESRPAWPLRPRGARHNGLGNMETLLWVVLIPVGAMVAVGMLATGLNVLAALIGHPLAHFR